MNTGSLQLITELWNNRDKTITEFNMYNDIFIDNCVIDAVYKLLVELQKIWYSLDLEYMIYIINKNHLSLEGACDNGDDEYSFIDFPPLKQMLIHGISLGHKLSLELQSSPGYTEMCKIVENE
jgi:hypothetical protein